MILFIIIKYMSIYIYRNMAKIIMKVVKIGYTKQKYVSPAEQNYVFLNRNFSYFGYL